MESLSELDGGLTGRLGATLHTTGPCVFGDPPADEPIWLRGRSDLNGVWSRSLVGPTSELISMGLTSWEFALRLLARLDCKYLQVKQLTLEI